MDSNNIKKKQNKWIICPECEEHIPRIKDIILYQSSQKIYIKYRCRCPLVTEKTIELKSFILKIKAIDIDNKPFCYSLSHPSRPSTNYCPLCDSWFCMSCIAEHKLNFPSHILSKKKFNLSYQCYMHNNREINQRCITCDSNGCEICIKNEHSKHKTVSYIDYWEEIYHNHQFKSLQQFKDYANHFITKNEDYKKKWFEKNKNLPEIVVNEINKSFKQNLDNNTLLIRFSKILLLNFYAMKSKQNFTVVNNIVNYVKYIMSNTDLNQRGTSRNLINHYKNCYIHHLNIHYKRGWNNANSHTDKIKGLVKLANGNIASYSDDHTIKIWDVYLFSCIETISSQEAVIIKVIQLKSNVVVSISKDNVIKVWEIDSNQSKASLMIDSIKIEHDIIDALKVNNDKVAIMFEKEIQIYKLIDNKQLILCLRLMKDDHIFKSMIALNDDESLLSISTNNELCKWRVGKKNSNETIDEIKSISNYKCNSTHISSMLELFNESIALTVDDNIIILQPDLKKEMRRLKVSNGLISCVIELDDERIVMGAYGSIIVWNSKASDTSVEIYNDSSSKITRILELEDLRLATIWNTHIIKLWNMASHKCISIIEAHQSAINCLLYLFDGKFMTASDDCSIKIWN